MAEYFVNTSPLYYLHRVGLLDHLRALLGRVTVPQQVVAELRAGRDLGHDTPDVSAAEWIEVRPVSAFESAVAESVRLGAGESAVLTLALRSGPGAVVVIDEAPARRVATRLGITTTGTLNLLVAAKRRGQLPAVAPIIDALEGLGFRMSAALRRTILALAGEA